MLMLLISIERDRCMSLPEGDERASALGDLVDGAPHLMDRIKAAIQEFSKLKAVKKNPYTESEQRLLYRILSAVNGDPSFIESAHITQAMPGPGGVVRLYIEGHVSPSAMRNGMGVGPNYDSFNEYLSRNTPFPRTEAFTNTLGRAFSRSSPSIRDDIATRSSGRDEDS